MATGDSQALDMEATGWSFAAVSIVLVAARLYTRFKLIHQPGWDDFWIVFALLTALVCTCLVQVAIRYGYGRHYNEITNPDHKMKAFKYTYLAPPFSMLSNTGGKISIVIFLLRLMGSTASPFKRWFLYLLLFANIVLNILAMAVTFGFCFPMPKIWLPETPGTCIDPQFQSTSGMIQSAFNAATDLILAFFPVFIFWKLQMELKVRIALIGVMSGGIFAAAATLVKTVMLQNLPQQDDITWVWASMTVWYSAEMYIIIICATIPTLRQFYLRIIKQPISDLSYGKSRDYVASNQPGGSIPLNSNPRKSISRNPSLGLGRGNDTTDLHETSSQEDILPGHNKSGIRKQTDVYIGYGASDVNQNKADNPHFPHPNPFAP